MPPRLRRLGPGRAPLLLLAVNAALPGTVKATLVSQPPTTEDAVRAAEKLQGPVTPISKVVKLLKDLQTKVADAGKAEAASYDKFACFCKEQADGKLYAIEKSNKTIARQSARIEELGSEIIDLTGAISDLGTLVTNKEGEISNMEEARNLEHEAYQNKSVQMDAAIDAVGRAIEALKESKAGVAGKTNLLAVTALTQVHEAVLENALFNLTAAQARVLDVQPGQPYSYGYHSNDVIQTLQELLVRFKKNKAELDAAEFEANSAFEKARLGLRNEAKFAGMEKAEKEKREAQAQEEKSALEQTRDEETLAMNADSSFLRVLTADCEEKALFWDQRSKTRASELTAIAQAIEVLETGVVPKSGANKRLTGIQVRQRVNRSAVAPSFLQLRGGGARAAGLGSAAAATQAELLRLLDGASSRLGSQTLALAALQVRSAQDPVDHFVKVRAIINDLISKLEAEALSEETQKSFCDTHVKAAVDARDQASSDQEAHLTTLTIKQAHADQLAERIADLSKEIAANKKALLEATELRQEESEENARTITDAKAGKEAVSRAIEVLQTFYSTAGTPIAPALLQRRSHYVPPDSDRSGATVADLSPDTAVDSKYAGEQDSAKGIISMLQVIEADFERTEMTVGDEESGAASDFKEFKNNNDDDVKAMQQDIDSKEGALDTLKEELLDLQEDISDAKTEHANSVKELERLREMCSGDKDTYEERVEKRNEEIEALKEAHAILENWKGA